MRLISIVTGVFTACLVAFFVLAQAGLSLGDPFFLWIGMFNLMIVAQFWSFANDIYTKDEGERLFAIVGFGASLGAVVGSRAGRSLDQAARRLPADAVWRRRARSRQLLLTTGSIAARPARWRGRRRRVRPITPRRRHERIRDGVQDTLPAADRLMLLLLNWVNTTGEYILGSIVKERATEVVRRGTGGRAHRRQLIGRSTRAISL